MSLVDNSLILRIERYLDLQALRQELVVGNMANVDTPRYETKDINFQQAIEQADMTLDQPVHPVVSDVRGLIQRPDGNNVNMDRESMVLAKTQLEFRVAAQVLRQEFQRILTAITEGGQQV